MSIYTVHSEADITTVSAGDEVDMYQTSTGRIMKATALELATYVVSSAASSASGTVTTSGNVGTLNKLYGAVVTDSQTITGQAAAQSVTITNSTVTVGDLIMATLDEGTNTTGIPVLRTCHAGAGVMTFKINNAATTATAAFAGTFIINYEIIKK
jgi:hypothetical protein